MCKSRSSTKTKEEPIRKEAAATTAATPATVTATLPASTHHQQHPLLSVPGLALECLIAVIIARRYIREDLLGVKDEDLQRLRDELEEEMVAKEKEKDEAAANAKTDENGGGVHRTSNRDRRRALKMALSEAVKALVAQRLGIETKGSLAHKDKSEALDMVTTADKITQEVILRILIVRYARKTVAEDEGGDASSTCNGSSSGSSGSSPSFKGLVEAALLFAASAGNGKEEQTIADASSLSLLSLLPFTLIGEEENSDFVSNNWGGVLIADDDGDADADRKKDKIAVAKTDDADAKAPPRSSLSLDDQVRIALDKCVNTYLPEVLGKLRKKNNSNDDDGADAADAEVEALIPFFGKMKEAVANYEGGTAPQQLSVAIPADVLPSDVPTAPDADAFAQFYLQYLQKKDATQGTTAVDRDLEGVKAAYSRHRFRQAHIRSVYQRRVAIIIDPIDGTNAFTQGDRYAPMTLVGVAIDGVPVIGVTNRILAEAAPKAAALAAAASSGVFSASPPPATESDANLPPLVEVNAPSYSAGKGPNSASLLLACPQSHHFISMPLEDQEDAKEVAYPLSYSICYGGDGVDGAGAMFTHCVIDGEYVDIAARRALSDRQIEYYDSLVVSGNATAVAAGEESDANAKVPATALPPRPLPPQIQLVASVSSTTRAASLEAITAVLSPFIALPDRGAGNKLLQVAKGLSDAMAAPSNVVHKWDTLAPHAFVRALGGVVMDGKGHELQYWPIKGDDATIRRYSAVPLVVLPSSSSSSSSLQQQQQQQRLDPCVYDPTELPSATVACGNGFVTRLVKERMLMVRLGEEEDEVAAADKSAVKAVTVAPRITTIET